MKTETAKHTPEPWDITSDNDTGPDDDYYVEWFQVGPARIEVQRGNREKAEANARRVQACVNACKGIADPSAVPDLLEALKAICEFWDFAAAEEGMSTPLSPSALIGGHDSDEPIAIHDIIRAAIRKATTQPS